ncbi:hypothetical protein [Nocardia thailandica]
MSEQHTPPPRNAGGGSLFRWNEDWLATLTGLALIALVLAGVVPDWLVP